MPTKKPYMKGTERGYSPADWFIPIIMDIVQRDYNEYSAVVRTEVVPDELFPLIVVKGARDVLREMEYRYDTQVRSMFPEMEYDDLKRLTVPQIQEKWLERNKAHA